VKTIFIDESGDLGIKERYFVIAVLIPENKKRISNLIKRFCGKNLIKEIKASQLSFEQKQFLFNRFSSIKDYAVSYIILDKSKIKDLPIFNDKNLLYCYMSALLVKDIIQTVNDNLTIVFDNRSTKIGSGNTLSDYIKIKAFTEWNYKNILTIAFVDSKDSKLVQAVDLAANAIYSKYNCKKDHFYNKLIIKESIIFP
jgi:hypothetical protein